MNEGHDLFELKPINSASRIMKAARSAALPLHGDEPSPLRGQYWADKKARLG